MPKLGIVADDLTGATTVGALLARVGVDTAVLFDPSFIETVEEHEALIVSSNSRSLPAKKARKRVRKATEKLRQRGAELFAKRIDTTCRGGIGPEVEGMLEALGEDHIAIVVPAMPQSRRIVVGGYSLIDSVLLARTAVASDVRTPVTESHLPTLLGGQFTGAVGHVAMDAVLAGPDQLRAALAAERVAGVRAILVDATSLDDIDAIADALVGLGWPVVCVDPGPFTERMAIRSGVVETTPVVERGTRTEPAASDRGTVLVVAGSAMSVTHTQLNKLREVPGTAVIDVRIEHLVADGPVFRGEVDRIIAEVGRLAGLGGTRVLLLGLESSLTGRLVDFDELERTVALAPGVAAALVPARLGELARLVADELGASLTGMYLTGGDVMVASCRAMEADGIKLVDYVIPQADQGVLVGGPHAGVPVVCKGGMTGTELTAVQCVNRIFDEKVKEHEPAHA
ncbi:MAG: four-carbon acid sugar kinase family protein [Propionicimonas sp.]|uniref:four-carbon acid sugar kinase family protein n=1 Tax=Propionicimonas sp. TaxID=1955623 RepID=UPI003D136054